MTSSSKNGLIRHGNGTRGHAARVGKTAVAAERIRWLRRCLIKKTFTLFNETRLTQCFGFHYTGDEGEGTTPQHRVCDRICEEQRARHLKQAEKKICENFVFWRLTAAGNTHIVSLRRLCVLFYYNVLRRSVNKHPGEREVGRKSTLKGAETSGLDDSIDRDLKEQEP
ncbi:hypothetical protein NDU88_005335 [Pleurodeles waltl]|uniref:Uncharacterized protein n=1 Tax=Pleurodeles waltl TaxID=8319 RepID=A0AAV7QHV8_PLEWA|nr:hypothetical protein NDU88_005335 [Pleurodeles waltl]